MKFDTVKLGWSIVYIEESQVLISKKSYFFPLKIQLVLENRVHPDEMPHFIWVYTVCQSTRLGEVDQYFLSLRMLSTFYVCCMYSSALQTRFYHGSKH